jgi:hypothetical protein
VKDSYQNQAAFHLHVCASRFENRVAVFGCHKPMKRTIYESVQRLGRMNESRSDEELPTGKSHDVFYSHLKLPRHRRRHRTDLYRTFRGQPCISGERKAIAKKSGHMALFPSLRLNQRKYPPTECCCNLQASLIFRMMRHFCLGCSCRSGRTRVRARVGEVRMQDEPSLVFLCCLIGGMCRSLWKPLRSIHVQVRGDARVLASQYQCPEQLECHQAVRHPRDGQALPSC